MEELLKESKENIINKETNQNNKGGENIYVHYFSFDFRYEFITPILKDIQIMAQLIKLIANNQISDIIFIKGNNSYSIHSRFYFRYQNIIDFYVKVLEVIETDYFTKISYFIYKTKPKSTEFKVNFLIFYDNDKSTKFHIEIILPESYSLSSKILDIIYNELKYNFHYLLKAIKCNKMNSYLLSSSIIKNEYFVLIKIIQNVKLIEYIIKGKLIKIEENEKKTSLNKQENEFDEDKEKSFILVNDKYKVLLNKMKDDGICSKLNSIVFKVLLIKIKEDKMIMQLKILINNEQKENNPFVNVITICIRKLTANSCFMFIKYIWDFSINDSIINLIKNSMNKCLVNIDKLSKTAKHY